MRIYVDADACPVIDNIISIAKKEDIPVILVKNYAHFSHTEYPRHVKTIYVDKGNDAADYKIVKLVESEDIVVTQDYGLASLCLSKGCAVLHHKGFAYSKREIDQLLEIRHQHAIARRSGQKTKGPSAFSANDRKKFCNILEKAIHSKHNE